MKIQYDKVSKFSPGVIRMLLEDAYSFNAEWKKNFKDNWNGCDSFFFKNPEIADNYGFITTLDNEPIGLAFWDPRNCPEYVEIGHNCILTKYKGNGYGKLQLEEAVKRIKKLNPKKIIVTTNDSLIPAQKNYESVGFSCYQRRKNKEAEFAGEYIDYVITLGEVKD